MKSIIIIFFSLTASLAFAGFNNALEYGHLSEEQKLSFNIYIHGVGSGFQAANSALAESGKDQLYCAPDNLTLTPQNYKIIFEKELKRSSEIFKSLPQNEPFPVEIVLLIGLESTFPCNK